MNEKNLFYQSTIRGITERETSKDTIYCGLTFRIKKDDFNKSAQGGIADSEHEKLEEEALKALEEIAADDGFLPDGVIERYEVYDYQNGDVLVMYRVPLQDNSDEKTATISTDKSRRRIRRGERHRH